MSAKKCPDCGIEISDLDMRCPPCFGKYWASIGKPRPTDSNEARWPGCQAAYDAAKKPTAGFTCSACKKPDAAAEGFRCGPCWGRYQFERGHKRPSNAKEAAWPGCQAAYDAAKSQQEVYKCPDCGVPANEGERCRPENPAEEPTLADVSKMIVRQALDRLGVK